MAQNGMGATPPLSGILPTPEAIKSAALSMIAAMKTASGVDLTAMCDSVREKVSDEIPVTAEMIMAGKEAVEMVQMLGAFVPVVEVIYRAMAALAPVELVSEGERAALAMRNETMAALTDMRTALDRAETELVALRTRLAERDASVLKAARHRV